MRDYREVGDVERGVYTPRPFTKSEGLLSQKRLKFKIALLLWVQYIQLLVFDDGSSPLRGKQQYVNDSVRLLVDVLLNHSKGKSANLRRNRIVIPS